MSFEFELVKPNVAGRVNPQLLSELVDVNLHKYEEDSTGLNLRNQGLFLELAKIAGLALKDNTFGIVGNTRALRPGKPQIQRGWHIDLESGYMVADIIPTEFPIASPDVVKAFMEGRCIKDTINDDESCLLTLLGEAMNELSDKSLKDEGFKIWSPQPYEVVSTKGFLHRPPVNTSSSPLNRNFAAVH